MSERVKKPLWSLVLAAGMVLGLALVGMTAQAAKDCKQDLEMFYGCQYLVEGSGTPQSMSMQFDNFGGSESPRVFIQTSGSDAGSIMGRCACDPKKPDPSKIDKIGFGQRKGIHCVVIDPQIMPMAGSESGSEGGSEGGMFSFDVASYEMEPSRGKLRKGQAVDENGNAIVFECVATAP